MGQVFGNSSHKHSLSLTGVETAVWAVKVVLITVGVVSSVILVKISVIPTVSAFVVSAVPCLRSFFGSLLSPPYIYILLNFIILTIAASSTFQQQSSTYLYKKPQKPPKALYRFVEKNRPNEDDQFGFPRREDSRELAVGVPQSHEAEPENRAMEPLNYMEEKRLSGSGLVSREGSADVKEMIVQAPSPGNPEEPAKLEEPNDTFDSIWKSIMESQGKQPPPELKKSDTWDSPPRAKVGRSDLVRSHKPDPEPSIAADVPAAVWARREMRKSDTFKEGSAASLKLIKHLSQDELNLRADAFIRQFNHDMRLQREESELRHHHRYG